MNELISADLLIEQTKQLLDWRYKERSVGNHRQRVEECIARIVAELALVDVNLDSQHDATLAWVEMLLRGAAGAIRDANLKLQRRREDL